MLGIDVVLSTTFHPLTYGQVSLNVQFKPWNICLDHVFWPRMVVGKIICHWWNSLIIISIMLALALSVRLLKLFMGESADHHFARVQWERNQF